MGYSLFLSHNSTDIAVVEAIKKRSRAAGVAVYTYEEDVRAGTNLASKLTEAIRNADGLVAILTKSGAARPAIQQEIGVALGLGKTVYALVEPGVDPASLTLLQGLEYISFELDKVESALLALQQSITHQQSRRSAQLAFAVLILVAIAGFVYLATKE